MTLGFAGPGLAIIVAAHHHPPEVLKARVQGHGRPSMDSESPCCKNLVVSHEGLIVSLAHA
jgi:hypothetical protein